MIVADLRAEVRGDPNDFRPLGTVTVYNVGGTADMGTYVAEASAGLRAVFRARRGVSAYHVMAQGLLALGLAEAEA
jgi:hypothetical protein